MVKRTDAIILSHWRTIALLKHYALKLPLQCIEKMGWELNLESKKLKFIFTPYLHFAGAFTTYDESTGTLFSSDIFGGFTEGFSLYVKDSGYFESIKLFHEHYMPSREILRHSLNKFQKIDLKLIAPQHGSIIPEQFIKSIISQLEDLECGIFLNTEDDTDIFRLSKLNRLISGFFRTVLSQLDFHKITNFLEKGISTIFPVISIDFFLKNYGGYNSSTEDCTYSGKPLKGLQSKDIDFIRSTRAEWKSAYNGWWLIHKYRVISIPLFTSEQDILFGYAIFNLKSDISIGKDISDIMKEISVPLGIAFERELMLYKVEQESHRYYQQAIKDELTGLHTRLYMKDALHGILKSNDRNPKNIVSVIAYDLDHFKNINDKYGHHSGDLVLKTVAGIILENIRGEDIDVRLGGEEFAVFIVDKDKRVAQIIAERIRLNVQNSSCGAILQDIKITISGGIAYRKKDENLDSLMDRADKALYESKENGRNRITVYS
jgi:diguanylate cyclase (GGDEF)-like protein